VRKLCQSDACRGRPAGKPCWLKRRSEEEKQEEALQAHIDLLPALAGADAEADEERKRKRKPKTNTTKTHRYVEAAFLWRVKTTHNRSDN
jgi:hypothetical protein